MGLISTEELLSPLSDSQPAGPNLEYDPGFVALERAAQGKPEQRMGDAVVAGEPPDWAFVSERCQELLERTRDLRLGVHFTRARLHLNGYPGFSEGLALIVGMLRSFWPSVHPELDREDGDDPTMRATALAALAAPSTLAQLRSTTIAQAPGLGSVRLRDLQGLSSAGPAPVPGSPPPLDAATIDAIFQGAELESLQAVAIAIKSCSQDLLGIDHVFEAHTGSRGPNLTPVLQVLREASNAILPRLTLRLPALGGDGPGESGGPETSAGLEAPILAGEIRSREDVVRAIDKICAYYQRYEPTSPLPLLLERCKRLVSSNFLEIIRDLAPDSVSAVEGLSGKKPQ